MKRFYVRGAFKSFLEREHQISTLFQVKFSNRINLKQKGERTKSLGGSGSLVPRKIFENLHTVKVILMFFEPKFQADFV